LFAGLDSKDLIELRLELIYAAQKAERALVALITSTQQEKNWRNYTADQVKSGKIAVEHADRELRTAAKTLLPTFEALAQAQEARVS
jgi:hypothetical protein